jgi:hypothetical protein
MFNSRSEAMLWVVSMVLMAGGGALGYLVTGSPWAWAIAGWSWPSSSGSCWR